MIFSMTLVFCTTISGQGTWTQKAKFPGLSTHEGIGFSINGKGYIVGGTIAYPNWTNEVWEYNPISDSWLRKANVPTVSLREPVAFVIGNKAYIGTGMTGSSLINNFWEFDPALDKWTAKSSFEGTFFSGGPVRVDQIVPAYLELSLPAAAHSARVALGWPRVARCL